MKILLIWGTLAPVLYKCFVQYCRVLKINENKNVPHSPHHYGTGAKELKHSVGKIKRNLQRKSRLKMVQNQNDNQ